MDNLYLNRMNSRQGIVKKEKEFIFEISIGSCNIIKLLQRYDIGMRLFFLTIPKPLKQHRFKKRSFIPLTT
jgi:hypothetical protein